LFMNIKLVAKKLAVNLIGFMFGTNLAKYIYPLIAESNAKSRQTVSGISGLQFYTPNALNRYRVDTFLEKEPETLEWIDRIQYGSVIWDIGANVGLYSCYAAKTRNCTVMAFEPSVLNLELLAKNIYINDLVDKVTIVPLPLAEKLSFSTLNMSALDWGGGNVYI
jgi:hypothetical protein